MALRPCLELGCPNLVERGRCSAHRVAHDRARRARRRARGVSRVYADPRWAQTRRFALRRAGGRCQALEDGKRCRETRDLHGHHDYPGGLEQMLVDGVDVFDEKRVVILCARHHAQVEAWLRAEARKPRFRR